MIINLSATENIRKVRKLTDPRLRKIRYGLRTLVYLLYQNKLAELREEYTAHDSERDSTLILREKEELDLFYHRHHISCWFCGSRMEDLIQESDSLFWFCYKHIP